MIPRAELDAASVWAAASRALIADGGRLDAELRRGGLAMMAAADEAERAVYRDAVADVVEAARASTAEAGRIAADGMWRASFGSEPAAHVNGVGIGLAHDEVFRRAACLFDGTGDAAAFSRRARAWLSGEFAKSYDWAMGDSQRAMGDPGVRYAHVPAGPKPCIHCLEMASKGFSYEQPPRAENHPGCQCVVVPGTAATRVEGYDPEGIASRIAMCAETVGVDPKADEERLRKLIRDEVGTRDAVWLATGAVPVPSFETPLLKREIEKERPHETRTARRLAEVGIRSDFVDDSSGLADLSSGVELKTLMGTASYNTVSGYIKGTSKTKRNAKAIIFDNYENTEAEDDLIAGFVLRSQSFARGKIYILRKDGKLVRVR